MTLEFSSWELGWFAIFWVGNEWLSELVNSGFYFGLALQRKEQIRNFGGVGGGSTDLIGIWIYKIMIIYSCWVLKTFTFCCCFWFFGVFESVLCSLDCPQTCCVVENDTKLLICLYFRSARSPSPIPHVSPISSPFPLPPSPFSLGIHSRAWFMLASAVPLGSYTIFKVKLSCRKRKLHCIVMHICTSYCVFWLRCFSGDSENQGSSNECMESKRVGILDDTLMGLKCPI